MNFYDKSEAVERLRTGFQSVLTDVSEVRDHGVEAIQRDLSNALNGGGVNTVATFVEALVHDHRTLQQGTVRWFIEVLVTYGAVCSADDGALIDGRNEAAVKLCQEIADLVDGTGSIPHI